MYFRDLNPKTELPLYTAALVNSHYQRVTVSIYDTEGDLVSRSVNAPVVEGQVDVDMDQAIARQLSLTLAGDIPFDPEDPGDRLYADRFIGVTYDIYVDALADWVQVPVFHGPISRAEQTEDGLTIEAQSKESLMLPPVPIGRGKRSPSSPPLSERAPALIKSFASGYGETRFRIPTIANATVIRATDNVFAPNRVSDATGVWPLLQTLGAVENRQVYYDADGYLTMRPWRDRQPRWVFSDGDGGSMLSQPFTQWDLSEFYNTVEVQAKAPKSAKQNHVTGRATLPKVHPLSAYSLRRNGVSRELKFTEKLDQRMKERAAKSRANKILKRFTFGALVAEFTSLPIPHLEPGDLIQFQTSNDVVHKVELRKFSLPLVADGVMTVGYNAKTGHKKFRPKMQKKYKKMSPKEIRKALR